MIERGALTGSPGDLFGAIIGALFVAIGLAAAAASLSARPRRVRAGLWFGVFCLLYGVRLEARSGLILALTPWPGTTFQYADAFLTYAILVPAGLFVEALVGPGWHRLVRRMWQATCVYALGAIVNDLAREPFASMWLNPPVVILTLFIQAGHLLAFARAGRWTIQIRAVVAAAGLFTAVAIYETVSVRPLFGGGIDAEPFAMLLFTFALGWFVLTRARQQAYAFVALSRELQLAREIQQSLLPREMPRVPGVRIQGAYLPMSAVAGDFYDVTVLDDGRIVVIVADVSGHGIPAALVASMVKVAFAAESERYDRPGDILAGINRALTGKFERAYVTACCIVVDRPRTTIAYAAAGHPPALLRRRRPCRTVGGGGMVLALLPVAAYETVAVPFEPGDRLLIYTDGLLEATSGDGDDFW